jgi:hypothetical protein
MVKSRRMMWERHLACMGGEKKSIQGEQRDHYEDLNIDGTLILKI